MILGKKAALRIPSTECWNGTVGGEMTLYTDVAGVQTETKIPILETGKELFELKVRSFLDAASAKVDRYSQKEIKILSTVKVAELQKQVDAVSRELRELDEQIQSLNWITELLEN